MPSMTSRAGFGQMPKAAMAGQRARPDAAGAAVEMAAISVAPPGELGARDAGVAAFVDDVVDFAAERVERGDRAAPLRRQEQEAVVEARAAGAALSWQYWSGSSCEQGAPNHVEPVGGRSTGRRRKTSPPTASIARGCVSPPIDDHAHLEADASGRTRAQRPPEWSIFRARSIWKAINAVQRRRQSPAAICVFVTPNRRISSCGR
jgi:hypothetical protein